MEIKVVVLVVGIGLRKEGDKGDVYNLLQLFSEKLYFFKYKYSFF